MPAVVIGPTVAIIGLSLAANAVKDLVGGSDSVAYAIWDGNNSTWIMNGKAIACLVCGIVTLAVTIICSVYGKKMLKMIPFVIGILAGYAVATIFTICGVKVINFSLFNEIKWYPDFTFLSAFANEPISFGADGFGAYLGILAVAYVPVAFVVFAEHIADHKNLSSIIGKDLLKEPGLHRTLLGDGIGSMAGAIFGGCPNTTYGESVGCVAISGNASVITILYTACMAIVISFIGPFSTFLATIPPCVMGGVCIALYGFIAVSGLKMIQDVDLNDHSNLFVVSVILIAGVGGLSMTFGKIKLTAIACALILGILTNLLCSKAKKNKEEKEDK
jgi:uracil permease